MVVARFQRLHPLAAHDERDRVDHNGRPTDLAGVGHDFGGAAAAVGRQTVPDGEQQVAVVYGLRAAVEIGVVALGPLAEHADLFRLAEQRLHICPSDRIEVRPELCRRKREQSLPAQLQVQGRPGKNQV